MIGSLDADSVATALTRTDLPPDVRRVLELRALTASASVKKAYAMEHQACRDDRLRNLIVHHGTHPGRPTGEGPQPLNLPKAGPKLVWCATCSRPHRPEPICPWCGALGRADRRAIWSWEMVPHVLEIIAARDYRLVERFFGDAMLAISGCVRGLFTSAPGHDLIASDYVSLQAVVLAMLAGEQWRIDAFRNRENVYLLSASKMTGQPVQFYIDYAEEHGHHHEDRQKGKYADLACGFQGWINAWRKIEVKEHVANPLPDDEVRDVIKSWRAASPAVVEFWGGQWRGPPWRRERAELFGLEGHFIAALQTPNTRYAFRGIGFFYDTARDVLTMTTLMGRPITYNRPRLEQSDRNADELSISYEGWNSNPQQGQQGWVRRNTYGGKICENITMATEVDIHRFGVINLRAAGYPVVLHTYDENVAEVPEGFGSIEEFERTMSAVPAAYAGWPIRAEGGWRAKRYRKG